MWCTGKKPVPLRTAASGASLSLLEPILCTGGTKTAASPPCRRWQSFPYDYSEDGISYTFSIVPGALGKNDDEKAANLIGLLDGYFKEGGHHINVNVLNRDVLLDAMEHPELYPQLTIRVSGYAVNFIKLSREQKLDVISRTFHDRF